MSLHFEVFDLDFPAGSPNKSASLITGPTKALLVDAGFTRADGHRLVAAILDSGSGAGITGAVGSMPKLLV